MIKKRTGSTQENKSILILHSFDWLLLSSRLFFGRFLPMTAWNTRFGNCCRKRAATAVAIHSSPGGIVCLKERWDEIEREWNSKEMKKKPHPRDECSPWTVKSDFLSSEQFWKILPSIHPLLSWSADLLIYEPCANSSSTSIKRVNCFPLLEDFSSSDGTNSFRTELLDPLKLFTGSLISCWLISFISIQFPFCSSKVEKDPSPFSFPLSAFIMICWSPSFFSSFSFLFPNSSIPSKSTFNPYLTFWSRECCTIGL